MVRIGAFFSQLLFLSQTINEICVTAAGIYVSDILFCNNAPVVPYYTTALLVHVRCRRKHSQELKKGDIKKYNIFQFFAGKVVRLGIISTNTSQGISKVQGFYLELPIPFVSTTCFSRNVVTLY